MGDEKSKLDWDNWSKCFDKIDKLDEISIENLVDVLTRYNNSGRKEIWVKHRHLSETAKIKNFVINTDGSLEYIRVWKKDGGFGAWEAEHCKLMNRPPEKKRKKIKEIKSKVVSEKGVKTIKEKIVSSTIFCEEHPNYKGMRRPRSGCKTCLTIYSKKK